MKHRPRCKMQNYKTPRRYHGRKLGDPGFGDDFLDTTPKAQPTGKKTDKLDLIKIKCSVKDTVKRMQKQATDWDKILAKDISDIRLSPQI